jgi:hypothetical protein
MDETKKGRFNAFDRDAEIEFSKRNLLHWFQADAAMFITFRTSDSLPAKWSCECNASWNNGCRSGNFQ